MTDAQPGRRAWCEWKEGHYFTFTGKRAPKYCPRHKPMATRRADRDRKAGYGQCSKCGRHRPLTFDRWGEIDPDYLVPACFCGARCWVEWWDSMYIPGVHEPEVPPTYSRIREARETGKEPGDYRARKYMPKGGTADQNEIMVKPDALNDLMGGPRRRRRAGNNVPSEIIVTRH